MWVWSDELAERVPKGSVEQFERLPLVAYAVASEADLDELAVEFLAEQRTADSRLNDHRAAER